ncbi:hypothetical protein MTF65_16740 [Streptomyces sp. APSN-46.1]|uniref:hypothetical protein n=1 Tax=Streptomyces sp. APSN-46.1 TaxID=2929049 RepID=UPI001FB55CEA|nr:hypothetical protein [Streptomyces sp. APSN-46.1]MCJ1678954.1 hypothetical protein [Streptomyces sp. APSN-46.1]
MHGPGLPPPQHGHQPSSGGVVALRVLFALLPILSCGFLAGGTLLRLALVTRKSVDWVLLVVSGVLTVLWVVMIELDPTADTSGWQSNVGVGGSLVSAVATCVYFLVADIRHYESRAAGAPPAPWYPAQPAPYAHPGRTAPSYGYPPAQAPDQTHVPPHVPPQVPPQPTPPPRIGQVRAELDELSELLRNQPRRPPQPGGPYQDPNDTPIQDPTK